MEKACRAVSLLQKHGESGGKEGPENTVSWWEEEEEEEESEDENMQRQKERQRGSELLLL